MRSILQQTKSRVGAGCRVRGMALREPLHPAQDSHKGGEIEQKETPRARASPSSPNTQSISQKEEMQMFKKNLKLICTAIGLVAVLVMGLATSGVTQQQPENPWARANVIKMLEAHFAQLTAAEGEPILNIHGAILWSDPKRLMAFVPPLVTSLPIDKLRAIAEGEEITVTVGGLYVGEDRRERGMRPGVYKIKLVGKSKVIFVDEEGNVAYEAPVTYFKKLTEPSTTPTIVLSIQCDACFSAGDSGGPQTTPPPGGTPPPPPPPGEDRKTCWYIKINLIVVEFGYSSHDE